ncbi:hypothetical protein BD413DRAFT_607715 [Trametes elegans]|nr:hypothetical protein BD413DRAFT_607715 [Trametes elegans]
MAARTGIGRIARLTLYSGPNCSLCDIAKAELAKVRQQRPFELETVNIQDPGQERWKRKYVYWIPALHVEGREVAKGRWDAQTHVLSACTEPFDRELVSLSRQLFNFYRGESNGPFQRIHEAEQGRQQRLRWLDEFEPGEIRGPLLREALNLRDGDPGEHVEWLRNMSCWGYPPGWVGESHPRERVWELITEGNASDEEECDFSIFTDDGVEQLRLPPGHPRTDGDTAAEAKGTSTAMSALRRWATYPDSYFLFSKLPVYKGSSVPAVGSDRRSSTSALVDPTYSADRQALWASILASAVTPPGTAEPSVPPPPPPPPPSSSPPPYPPWT